MNYSVAFKYIICLLFWIQPNSAEIEMSSNPQENYFEGELIYEIEYKSHIPNVSASYFEENYGVKMIMLFRKGNYVQRYYNQYDELLSELFLKINSNISYYVPVESDTAYWFNIENEDSKSTIKYVRDTVISQHSCIHIKLESDANGSEFKQENLFVEGDNFYSKSILLNPKWYEDYYESNYNTVIKEGKGILYKSISNDDYRMIETTLKSFKKRKIRINELKMQSLCDRKLKQL